MSVEDESVIGIDIMDNPDTRKTTIEEFLKRNKVKADNVKAICGDGRFTADESEGFIRMFGGDEGALMAIKGALNRAEINIDTKELVAKYLQAIKEIRGQDAKIGTHTDEKHAKEGRVGCGHMARAMSIHGLHEFLSMEEAAQIHQAVLSTEHEEVVLQGEHQEQNVLRVHGTEWSVNSSDEHSMNFVVDIDRATQFLETIVPMLGIYGLQTQDVLHQFESQMDKTAQQLAAGKNIYDVDFDIQGHPTATFGGVVPHPALQN